MLISIKSLVGVTRLRAGVRTDSSIRRAICCTLLVMGTLASAGSGWAAQRSRHLTPKQAGGRASAQSGAKGAANRSPLESLQRKLDYLQRNGAQARPNPAPTEITEAEANAWFAAGRVKLPKGVKSVVYKATPGVIEGDALVDFDEVTENARSSNPLLGMFTGTHNVTVVADADGRAGNAHVHVRWMAIDGVGIPRIALEYFADRYVTAKYPGVGMDSTFRMPARIDKAIVGSGRVLLYQK